MRDDRGIAVSLAQYRGKVVLMNLWASWCPPCREEMPDLQRLFRVDVSRGLIVVGVDQGESAQRAQRFAASLEVTYPVWLDDAQDYGRAYAALGLPTTVVVDRSGIIVRAFDGALTYQQMRSAVAPLLSRR
jgi:thiol-disulfide isomerase/thioredoxin